MMYLQDHRLDPGDGAAGAGDGGEGAECVAAVAEECFGVEFVGGDADAVEN